MICSLLHSIVNNSIHSIILSYNTGTDGIILYCIVLLYSIVYDRLDMQFSRNPRSATPFTIARDAFPRARNRRKLSLIFS
jgi:hypothetical protein